MSAVASGPSRVGMAGRAGSRRARSRGAHGRRGRVPSLTSRRIVAETLTVTVSERGATRMDDRTSDASMERRKKEGYF